jgi:hypothetical protein
MAKRPQGWTEEKNIRLPLDMETQTQNVMTTDLLITGGRGNELMYLASTVKPTVSWMYDVLGKYRYIGMLVYSDGIWLLYKRFKKGHQIEGSCSKCSTTAIDCEKR